LSWNHLFSKIQEFGNVIGNAVPGIIKTLKIIWRNKILHTYSITVYERIDVKDAA